MTMRSISRRVYRAILAVSAASMAVMVLTVLLVNEDLERTMLKAEFAQEREFLLMNGSGSEVIISETPNLSVAFVPTGHEPPPGLPEMFRGLPDGYAAELERGDETYLVTVDAVRGGLLYVAKNITLFEEREALFDIALLVMTMVIIGLSLLLAVLSSRRIVRPLTLLSERISRIPVGPNMPRMETDYSDAELHSIAMTFNRFLDELESYVRREQSLISLASHELRTPIAVMSGALDILEQRDRLHPGDRATLQRVRRSCDEMKDNVDVLLKLARRDSGQTREPVDLPVAVQRVIDDLKASHDTRDRVSLDVRQSLSVVTDPVMVHMLLRNLVQNAVQHTKSAIRVTISSTAIDIEDHGPGLNAEQQDILQGRRKLPTDGSALSGLGLYIVTLMTERLGWTLQLSKTDDHGTRVRLRPSRRGERLDPASPP